MNLKLKTIAASFLAGTGITSLLETWQNGADLVFALHRVLPTEEMTDCYNPHIAITPESFDSFLKFLRERADIVSLAELLRSRSGHRGRRCALTFDDGWEDNFRVALPILRAHSAAATIFLVSGFVGSDTLLPEERFSRVQRRALERAGQVQWQQTLERLFAAVMNRSQAERDYQKVLKRVPIRQKLLLLGELEQTFGYENPPRLRALSWEQVRAMAAANISIGSHTVRHALLNSEEPDVIRKELADSKREIGVRAGTVIEYLAYPNGGFNEGVIRLAGETGYTAAVTTRVGAFRGSTGLFEIPRIAVDNGSLHAPDGNFHVARARLHLALSAAD